VGWGRWGLREVAVIAIRHPAYLALTDGECVVPHRGVTACNDIRGTMKPGTHFLSILFGHWLVPMLHPSFPLSCIGISPSTLTGDRVLLCYAISKSNAFTNTSTFKQAIMDIAAAKTQRRTQQGANLLSSHKRQAASQGCKQDDFTQLCWMRQF